MDDMKIISWNVAGINACVKKGLFDFMRAENAEIYCFQEVKASDEKMPRDFDPKYHAYHSISARKGYSGVSIFTKIKPLSIMETGKVDNEKEGRILVLEFERFFLINAYFPHAHRELKRLEFKLIFNERFLTFCKGLEKKKPLIIAADFNVAHKEIDLANFRQNRGNAGFTDEERKWFDDFLACGFIDTFREFVAENGHYTWWTYRNGARERNIGWRIDYFLTSSSLKSHVKESKILKDVLGSDHCPIVLKLEF